MSIDGRPLRSHPAPSAAVPFDVAVAAIRGLAVRPEIDLAEVPAPTRLAPHAIAITAEVSQLDEAADGRLVILHDPAGVIEWQGDFRVVAFIRADLEPDISEDPALCDVAWTWLTEALDAAGAQCAALAGTVTRTSSTAYGELAPQTAGGRVEIRASWTPLSADLGPHGQAWLDVVSQAAGLPQLPSGIATLPRMGRR